MNLIAGVPKELFGQQAESWLQLKDLVILDSAFCNHTARSVLHESLHMSVIPTNTKIVFHRHQNTLTEALKWLAKRKLILETAYFQSKNDSTQWTDYLREFGTHVKTVFFQDSSPVAAVAKFCPNVQSFVLKTCDFSDAIIGLLSLLEWLESIRVEGYFTKDYSNDYLPTSHHLRIKELNFACEDAVEKSVLKLCAPECVQRLQCGSIDHQDWSQFTSFRSLGFHRYCNFEALNLVHSVQQLYLVATDHTTLFALKVSAGSFPVLRTLYYCDERVRTAERLGIDTALPLVRPSVLLVEVEKWYDLFQLPI